MIHAAGDLGILIDYGDNQPGSVLQRRENPFSDVWRNVDLHPMLTMLLHFRIDPVWHLLTQLIVYIGSNRIDSTNIEQAEQMYSFENPDTWCEKYAQSLSNIFPKEYENFIEKDQYAFSDISSCQFDDLAKDFWPAFSNISAFHGCRILDESSYQKKGIEPLSYSRVKEILFNITLEAEVLADQFSLDDIADVIRKYETPIREGRVFLALDSRLFSQWGGTHYLLNGSEFVSICLNELVGRDTAKEILNSIGRRCIINCLLPVNSFDFETLGLLCFNTLNAFVEVAMPLSPFSSFLDFTLSPNHVTPKEIVAFKYQ